MERGESGAAERRPALGPRPKPPRTSRGVGPPPRWAGAVPAASRSRPAAAAKDFRPITMPLYRRGARRPSLAPAENRGRPAPRPLPGTCPHPHSTRGLDVQLDHVLVVQDVVAGHRLAVED